MSALRARARRFAFAHVGGTALVLLYHRVADLDTDPQLLAVGPGSFDAQLEVLARDYRVLSLAGLIGELRRRRVPDRSVVVTFDDGYADNLANAAPVLAAHGVPATVFVSSGHLGGRREFWWDELEQLVLAPETLPARLDIELASVRFTASIHAEHVARDPRWNVLEPGGSPREDLYRRLAAFVRPLSPSDRDAALAQLREQAGIRPEQRASHRQLTAGQVAELDSSGVVDIGAHTVSHAVLSTLGIAEQREEIEADRDALAALCGHPIRAFSYPYGGVEDYSAETVELVRSAGFEGACSNHAGVVKPWTDPYRIPRVVVRDWDAETFGREVAGWFDDPR